MAKKTEIQMPVITEDQRRAREAAEAKVREENRDRRREFLGTLDPRQRVVLSWDGE